MQEIKGSKGEYPLIFAKLGQRFIHLLKPLLCDNKNGGVLHIWTQRGNKDTRSYFLSREL